MNWFVYIVQCADGSFYVGHSHHVGQRFHRHAAGGGALYTLTHHPEAVVYHERLTSEADAIRREREIKKWSRAKKLALIAGGLSRLRFLAKSHS